MTIAIQLNGDQLVYPAQTTIANLVEQLGLTGKRIAIEVNHQIIPRSLHVEYILKADDKVEVIHAIGGG